MHRNIRGDQRCIEMQRMGDQHAIHRIAMQVWQRIYDPPRRCRIFEYLGIEPGDERIQRKISAEPTAAVQIGKLICGYRTDAQWRSTVGDRGRRRATEPRTTGRDPDERLRINQDRQICVRNVHPNDRPP